MRRGKRPQEKPKKRRGAEGPSRSPKKGKRDERTKEFRAAHAKQQREAAEFKRRSLAAKKGWITRRGYVPAGLYHFTREVEPPIGPGEGRAAVEVGSFFGEVDDERPWAEPEPGHEVFWVWTAGGEGLDEDGPTGEEVTIGTQKTTREKSENLALNHAYLQDEGTPELSGLGRYGLTWERMEIFVSVEPIRV